MMRLPADEISRRSFLKTAATATGGLVIAMYLPACSKPEEAAKHAGPVKLINANAWLKIGTDGSITVLCDRSEMGQGVYTALPTLLAEDLGVAPSTIKVEFAPPGKLCAESECFGQQLVGASARCRVVRPGDHDKLLQIQNLSEISQSRGDLICGSDNRFAAKFFCRRQFSRRVRALGLFGR